jgi:hypothetical protein
MDVASQVAIDNKAGVASMLADGQNVSAEPELLQGPSVHLVTLECVVVEDVLGNAGQNASMSLVKEVLQIGSVVDPVRLSSTVSNGDDISTSQNVAEVCSTHTRTACAFQELSALELLAHGHGAAMQATEMQLADSLHRRCSWGTVLA